MSEFKVVHERQGVGPRIPKPEMPKQQPSTPDRTLYERLQRGRSRSGIAGGEAHNETYRRLQEFFEREPRGSTVFEGPLRVPRPLPQNPGEHRGETEPFQPNPAEQQAKERLGKPPPKRRGRPEKPLERTDTGELPLGSLIRKYRAEKGMSMKELAAQVGYHPHSLSGIETNAKNPSSVKLWNIAKSLEVPVEELLQAPVHPKAPVPFWKSPRFGGIGRAPMRPAMFRGHEHLSRRPSDEGTQAKP